MPSIPQAENVQIRRVGEIQAGRITIVARGLPLAVAANLLVGGTLGAVQWRAVQRWAVIGWLSALVLINGLRLYPFLRGWIRSPAAGPVSHQWLWWGTALSGLTWGAAGLVLFPPSDIAHQVFLALCVAGISAGSVTTLSALFPCAATFLFLALSPLALRFLAEPATLPRVSGLLVVLFLALMLTTSFRLHRTIGETLRERFERALAEEAALHQALYDDLTELPNRRLFLERLERALAHALRHGNHGAVVFLDLDNFKHINDSLGHRAGDLLLREAASRIRARTRHADTAARLGGDEFVLLLPDLGPSRSEAMELSQLVSDLRSLLSEPFRIVEDELHVTASIGVALFPTDGQTPEEVLQHADVAMYRAKDLGRDGVQFFLPGMREAVDRRLTLQRELRQALDRDELFLAYQTQVDADGVIIGAEALLRWQHPHLGVVLPARFIPTAEETGLIIPIGARTLELACRDLQALADRLPGRLAVNISPRQFRDGAFIDALLGGMHLYGTDPHRLYLEIAEGSAMADHEEAVNTMEALRALGVGFVIDNFGKGFSSLARLRRLPVEAIKIDRSFVRDAATDSDDAAIVETIIVMARHLGLDVIAEGVESDAALAFLAARGCTKFQGYHFSRPVTLNELFSTLNAAREGSSQRSTGGDDGGGRSR